MSSMPTGPRRSVRLKGRDRESEDEKKPSKKKKKGDDGIIGEDVDVETAKEEKEATAGRQNDAASAMVSDAPSNERAVPSTSRRRSLRSATRTVQQPSQPDDDVVVDGETAAPPVSHPATDEVALAEAIEYLENSLREGGYNISRDADGDIVAIDSPSDESAVQSTQLREAALAGAIEYVENALREEGYDISRDADDDVVVVDAPSDQSAVQSTQLREASSSSHHRRSRYRTEEGRRIVAVSIDSPTTERKVYPEVIQLSDGDDEELPAHNSASPSIRSRPTQPRNPLPRSTFDTHPSTSAAHPSRPSRLVPPPSAAPPDMALMNLVAHISSIPLEWLEDDDNVFVRQPSTGRSAQQRGASNVRSASSARRSARHPSQPDRYDPALSTPVAVVPRGRGARRSRPFGSLAVRGGRGRGVASRRLPPTRIAAVSPYFLENHTGLASSSDDQENHTGLASSSDDHDLYGTRHSSSSGFTDYTSSDTDDGATCSCPEDTDPVPPEFPASMSSEAAAAAVGSQPEEASGAVEEQQAEASGAASAAAKSDERKRSKKHKKCCPRAHIDEECMICLDKIRRHAVFSKNEKGECLHRFHAGCLRGWIRKGGRSCPTCRAYIKYIRRLKNGRKMRRPKLVLLTLEEEMREQAESREFERLVSSDRRHMRDQRGRGRSRGRGRGGGAQLGARWTIPTLPRGDADEPSDEDIFPPFGSDGWRGDFRSESHTSSDEEYRQAIADSLREQREEAARRPLNSSDDDDQRRLRLAMAASQEEEQRRRERDARRSRGQQQSSSNAGRPQMDSDDEPGPSTRPQVVRRTSTRRFQTAADGTRTMCVWRGTDGSSDDEHPWVASIRTRNYCILRTRQQILQQHQRARTRVTTWRPPRPEPDRSLGWETAVDCGFTVRRRAPGVAGSAAAAASDTPSDIIYRLRELSADADVAPGRYATLDDDDWVDVPVFADNSEEYLEQGRQIEEWEAQQRSSSEGNDDDDAPTDRMIDATALNAPPATGSSDQGELFLTEAGDEAAVGDGFSDNGNDRLDQSQRMEELERGAWSPEYISFDDDDQDEAREILRLRKRAVNPPTAQPSAPVSPAAAVAYTMEAGSTGDEETVRFCENMEEHEEQGRELAELEEAQKAASSHERSEQVPKDGVAPIEKLEEKEEVEAGKEGEDGAKGDDEEMDDDEHGVGDVREEYGYDRRRYERERGPDNYEDDRYYHEVFEKNIVKAKDVEGETAQSSSGSRTSSSAHVSSGTPVEPSSTTTGAAASSDDDEENVKEKEEENAGGQEEDGIAEDSGEENGSKEDSDGQVEGGTSALIREARMLVKSSKEHYEDEDEEKDEEEVKESEEDADLEENDEVADENGSNEEAHNDSDQLEDLFSSRSTRRPLIRATTQLVESSKDSEDEDDVEEDLEDVSKQEMMKRLISIAKKDNVRRQAFNRALGVSDSESDREIREEQSGDESVAISEDGVPQEDRVASNEDTDLNSGLMNAGNQNDDDPSKSSSSESEDTDSDDEDVARKRIERERRKQERSSLRVPVNNRLKFESESDEDEEEDNEEGNALEERIDEDDEDRIPEDEEMDGGEEETRDLESLAEAENPDDVEDEEPHEAGNASHADQCDDDVLDGGDDEEECTMHVMHPADDGRYYLPACVERAIEERSNEERQAVERHSRRQSHLSRLTARAPPRDVLRQIARAPTRRFHPISAPTSAESQTRSNNVSSAGTPSRPRLSAIHRTPEGITAQSRLSGAAVRSMQPNGLQNPSTKRANESYVLQGDEVYSSRRRTAKKRSAPHDCMRDSDKGTKRGCVSVGDQPGTSGLADGAETASTASQESTSSLPSDNSAPGKILNDALRDTFLELFDRGISHASDEKKLELLAAIEQALGDEQALARVRTDCWIPQTDWNVNRKGAERDVASRARPQRHVTKLASPPSSLPSPASSLNNASMSTDVIEVPRKVQEASPTLSILRVSDNADQYPESVSHPSNRRSIRCPSRRVPCTELFMNITPTRLRRQHTPPLSELI